MPLWQSKCLVFPYRRGERSWRAWGWGERVVGDGMRVIKLWGSLSRVRMELVRVKYWGVSRIWGGGEVYEGFEQCEKRDLVRICEGGLWDLWEWFMRFMRVVYENEVRMRGVIWWWGRQGGCEHTAYNRWEAVACFIYLTKEAPIYLSRQLLTEYVYQRTRERERERHLPFLCL